jgi:hypothetical protein
MSPAVPARGTSQPTAEAGRRLAVLPDEQLGSLVVFAAISELPWTPDVVGAVTDRLERDALAYPEHFARAPWSPFQPGGRAAGRRRTGRMAAGLLTLLVVVAIILGLVLVMPQGTAAALGVLAATGW